MNKVLATNLYKALKQVKRTGFSPTFPILNHVKMDFADGYLTLTSTDLEKPLTAKCPVVLEEEWSTCAPLVTKIKSNTNKDGHSTYQKHAHKYYPFLDFVKVTAEYGDVLEFTFDPTIQTIRIKVQGEKSYTEFKCLDAQEFPTC